MAENLIGSEIIRLAGEINKLIAEGATIYNFTIGDFNSDIFPIPALLKSGINKYYDQNQTNYPEANGAKLLRVAAANFVKNNLGLDYSPDDYLITAGSRPIIYATFATLLDAGDKVVFPVPSWNNNHYAHLFGAEKVEVPTLPDQNFMPTAAMLAPHLHDATLLALCSPLNPTGTVFEKDQLLEICQLVVAENQRRPATQKPLYLLYDQIYWTLTYGTTQHHDPVSLLPAMRPYTIFVDGISKAFAATGVRVGWTYGPSDVMAKMKSILSHMGAWAPKPEQLATADFLNDNAATTHYLDWIKSELSARLNTFYSGFMQLKADGFSVDAVAPQAALYLTISFNIHGRTTKNNQILHTTADITQYLLTEAGLGITPFYAFGADKNSAWYRLSVGTCTHDDVAQSLIKIREALSNLT
jgi:aspartate aminotransferase